MIPEYTRLTYGCPICRKEYGMIRRRAGFPDEEALPFPRILRRS